MDKPITLVIDDFKKELVKLINSSTLPLCVMDYIVTDIRDEIHLLSERQMNEDRAAYEKSIEQDVEEIVEEFKEEDNE